MGFTLRGDESVATSTVFSSDRIVRAQTGKYDLCPGLYSGETGAFPLGQIIVKGPSVRHDFFCLVGARCSVGPVSGLYLDDSDRVQISTACLGGQSVGAVGFPNNGIASAADRTSYTWDEFADFSSVQVGTYRVCWSWKDPVTNVFDFNLDIGSLTIVGPETNQLFDCFDQLPCVVSGFRGFGTGPGNVLGLIGLDAICSPNITADLLSGLPQGGISVASLDGNTFSFGTEMVNISTPVTARVCWSAVANGTSFPIRAGTLRIGSYAEYYRRFITSSDWSEREPIWKVLILSLILPFLLVCVYLSPWLSARLGREEDTYLGNSDDVPYEAFRRIAPFRPLQKAEALALAHASEVDIGTVIEAMNIRKRMHVP